MGCKKKVAFLYPRSERCGINNYSKHLYPFIKKTKDFEVHKILFENTSNFFYYTGLARKLSREYDMVHLQHEFATFGRFGIGLVFFAFGISKPFVVTFHEFHDGIVGLKEKFILLPFKAKISKVIVLSKGAEGKAVRFFGKRKVVNTEHGLSKSSEIVEKQRVEKGLIVHPGFIRYNKNQLFTLELAKILPEKKFIFLGNGAEKYFKEVSSKAFTLKNVSLTGYVSDKNYLKIISKAELIIMPYFGVVQSGVLCDALFLRKMILASDRPYFKELENEGIIFTSPLVAEAFAKKIVSLTSRKIPVSFTKRLDDYAKDNSLDRLAEKNLAVYKLALW